MHIRCVLDALMLSMKRWARFPHSRTGYAPPLYSYTAYTHRLSGPCTVYDDTADPVYSDAAYTLYSAIHSPSVDTLERATLEEILQFAFCVCDA